MKKFICLFFVLFILGLAGCQKDASGRQAGEGASAPAGGSSAQESQSAQSLEKPLVPDFELEANNGGTVSLADYKGKVVVLNFWASWCPPCKEEMPDFQKLHEELKDSDEVVLLMLNQTDGQRETKEKADAYLSDNGFDFLCMYDSGEVGYSMFGIQSIPTTVVIDQEGRLSNYVLGMTDYDTVATMIEEAK